MDKEQKIFLAILDKHCIENKSNFTSNEFHTIWNAMTEYNKLNGRESILVELSDGRIINAKPCSECDNYFEEKEIIIKGDVDTCDSCLCPE